MKQMNKFIDISLLLGNYFVKIDPCINGIWIIWLMNARLKSG